jgi:hypothetical protein
MNVDLHGHLTQTNTNVSEAMDTETKQPKATRFGGLEKKDVRNSSASFVFLAEC